MSEIRSDVFVQFVLPKIRSGISSGHNHDQNTVSASDIINCPACYAVGHLFMLCDVVSDLYNKNKNLTEQLAITQKDLEEERNFRLGVD